MPDALSFTKQKLPRVGVGAGAGITSLVSALSF